MIKCGTCREQAADQLLARARYWAVIHEAKASHDTKAFSRVPANRDALLEATAAVHTSVAHKERSLKLTAALIRSRYPDRAQSNVNPTRIAVAAQPALDQGLITPHQVKLLVAVAKSGIQIPDFRDLSGPALDLSQGNAEDEIDQAVLLDFYFEQAFLARVLMLPPEKADQLDESGELVLSPSFLVRIEGKKPRSILNLSSTACGVNQRLRARMNSLQVDFEADPDGYSTVQGVVLMLIQSYVRMVTNPGEFNTESIDDIRLAMMVMDGDAAFFRWPVSTDMVGLQATRVARITILALCCVFGAEMSAINFSFVTAAVKALHASHLDSASISRVPSQPTADRHPALQALLEDDLPAHSHLSKGHVDDFAALELLSGQRPRASAMDLAWAIQVFLGTDGLSDKKWKASSFWTDLQKVIGAWFDVTTFSVVMPQDKLQSALELLQSPEFGPEADTFSINLCASLEGKLRWATLATPLGSTGALINICKQRLPNNTGDRLVRPARFQGESVALSLAKFRNELLVRRLFLEAAMIDPSLVSCSMLSMLKVEDRLAVPGESIWLVWLSGDFSMEGNSFGVEYLHATLGYQRRYCFIAHPQTVIDALRKALAGLSEKKGYAIVSAVCERQNKLMAEFQWRKILACRPCIVLEDNTASVACINVGYSSNVIMQAMQLASNLRQALDEARMTASYTTSRNMSFHDRVSRLDLAYVARANIVLSAAGMQQWEQEEPCIEALAIRDWLPEALLDPFPLLKSLLQGLNPSSRVPKMPSHGLDPEVIARPADLSWQLRVQAAAIDMPCEWGSFGPNAYNVSHLTIIAPTPAAKPGQAVQISNRTAARRIRQDAQPTPHTEAASSRTQARRARQALARTTVPRYNATTMDANGSSKHKPGYSLFLNLNRDQLSSVPISEDELLAMSMLQESLRFKHIEASKDAINMSIRHWRSFCRRFNRPVHLRCGSLELDRAAAAQAELFILYELSTFDIKASSVVEKIWAVGKEHEACRLQNPFRENDILRQVAKAVCKLDGPPQPKIPMTDAALNHIAVALDFSKRESWVVWTGIRVALAFLCRISEWGFREKHAMRWYAVAFFDEHRETLLIDSVADLDRIFEVEITFFSDKTHNFGEGTCRSFFAIPDKADDRCIARDLGRLWLLSEKCQEHHVFSWANDTEGPTREKISAVLKAAAIKEGIPAADVCTHSLRISGLSRLLAAGMPYESARTYGRWKSDCVRRYWWPATSLAQDFSVRIWTSPTYSRVRGGGAVQTIR